MTKIVYKQKYFPLYFKLRILSKKFITFKKWDGY